MMMSIAIPKDSRPKDSRPKDSRPKDSPAKGGNENPAPPLCIIAGRGALPRHLAAHCDKINRPCFVLSLVEEEKNHPPDNREKGTGWPENISIQEISLLTIVPTLIELRAKGVKEIILAGGWQRPQWQGWIMPDRHTAAAAARIFAAQGINKIPWARVFFKGRQETGQKMAPKMAPKIGEGTDQGTKKAKANAHLKPHLNMGQGDDYLLRAVIGELERMGFTVSGADSLDAGLLANDCLYGRHAPSQREKIDIALGRRAAKLLGRLDIGQSVVVCHGRIIAVEAAEGTDAVLQRCALLNDKKGDKKKRSGGVLIKNSKPGQDKRVDLPCVGIETLRQSRKAGLSGIAIEAGATIMLEKDGMIAYANRHHMFLIGIDTQSHESNH